MQKEDLEIELAKLKIAAKIRLTEEDIKKWLNSFCKGDLFDMDFRRRIIDTFINAIYLFDDKIVIYYNIKDSKQVSYIEMAKDIEEISTVVWDCTNDKRSNFNPSAPPYRDVNFDKKLTSLFFA